MIDKFIVGCFLIGEFVFFISLRWFIGLVVIYWVFCYICIGVYLLLIKVLYFYKLV